MRDHAIYNTHSTVVSILEGIKALDKDGKPVTLDNVKVDAELAKLQAIQTSKVFNAPIYEQLKALDARRVRPLAEGDTAYLATINKQIAALRGLLK